MCYGILICYEITGVVLLNGHDEVFSLQVRSLNKSRLKICSLVKALLLRNIHAILMRRTIIMYDIVRTAAQRCT